MDSSKFTLTETWTLIATILGSSIVFVDTTALNVALPALQKDLEITATQLLWVVNAYSLFLSSLILVGGAMGDAYGRNKIFSIGIFIFMISSLAVGLSSNPIQLIGARVFQGIGGALLTPGSLSIITTQVAEERRGKAIGIWSTFSALTGIIGPVLGGWLASEGMWRVIFFINIPISLLVLAMLYKKVPESKDSNVKDLDFLGAILGTLALIGISYGLIESSNLGFDNIIIRTSLGLGITFFIAFYLSQKFGKRPMLPLKLFNSRTFSATNIFTLFLYAALGGITFFMPLNMVQIQGYEESEAGLAMIPIILMIALISPLSGKVMDRIGARTPLIIGPILIGVAFYLFGVPNITNGFSDYFTSFFPAFLLLGIGLGITVAPLTTAVMGSIPKESSGIGSGVNNAISRVAGVLAIATFGTIILFSFKNNLASNIEYLNLEETEISWLMKEAENLGATGVPKDLEEAVQLKIKSAIKISFLNSIKDFTLMTAILAWFSAVIAFLFVEQKK